MDKNRILKNKPSSLALNTLQDPAIISALSTLRNLIKSSYGPLGKACLIHNNKGGQVTVSSSSQRILSCASLSNSILKFVTAAAQSHLSKHSDGGLFVCLLALDLILKGLDSDISRSLLRDVFSVLLSACLDHLKSEDFKSKAAVDTSHIDDLLCLIFSVLSAKSSCQCSASEFHLISRLLLKGIVSSQLSDDSSSIRFLCLEGLSPSQSYLIDGILIDAPQFPVFRARPFDIQHCNVKIDGSLRRCIKVAVISASLSGDSDDLPDVHYEVVSKSSLTDIILEKIAKLVCDLAALDVGLVMCQKVIHPRVKRQLKEAGILAMDRLGLEAIQCLHLLAGE